MSVVGVNEGTSKYIHVDSVGTEVYNVTKIDMGAVGTTNLFAGTISELTNLTKGTITKLEGGTVSVNMLSGTMNLGTVSGNVGVSSGTLTTLPNIPGGTIGVVTSVTNIASGTLLSSGTVTGVGVVSALTNGTIVVSVGTITHGTIDAGTVRTDGRTVQNLLSYGTQVAGTAAAYGTLVGSTAVGAGTSSWVQDISIVNPFFI